MKQNNQAATNCNENEQNFSKARCLCVCVAPYKIRLLKITDRNLPEFALNFICDTLQMSYLTNDDICGRKTDIKLLDENV